jgi:sulfite exporter TauE/SafE
VIGLLAGLRHAFEPDHLSAVSTLVADTGDARRGAMLGAMWGLGHTLALALVGIILASLGAVMPKPVAAALECAVAVMLIVLGARAVRRALREGESGPLSTHRHGLIEHTHPDLGAHVHVRARSLSWRPLLVGIVHGLAGSGALTALVFSELRGTKARIAYVTLFGMGSMAGMSMASCVAGASVGRFGERVQRRLSVVTGTLAIAVGIAWTLPMVRC